MLTTVEGIYRDGKIELTETPPGVSEGRVLVTFLENGAAAPRRGQMMRFGQFAGPYQSTEEDFKIAEWHGEDVDI